MLLSNITVYRMADFWSKLEKSWGTICVSIKSSVKDVERIIRDIIKVSKYRKCIENITDKKEGYLTVKYNELSGRRSSKK